jgi:hypothetical protein
MDDDKASSDVGNRRFSIREMGLGEDEAQSCVEEPQRV